MNFDQGMRRLAMFLGALGAIAGGMHAYKVLKFVPSERYQHKVFEKLAASDVVKREQSRLLSMSAIYETEAKKFGLTYSPPRYSAVNQVDYEALARTSGGTVDQEIKGLPPGAVVEPIYPPSNVRPPKGFTLKTPPATLPPDFKGWDQQQPSKQTLPSNGIKTIFWKPDFSVDFFEMQDGGSVNSEPSPSIWLYPLWFAYPAIGFAVVWGAVFGTGWVIAGFCPALKSTCPK